VRQGGGAGCDGVGGAEKQCAGVAVWRGLPATGPQAARPKSFSSRGVTRATTIARGLADPRAFASANYFMALMLADGGGLGRAPTSNPNETRTRSSMSVAAALARCTFSAEFQVQDVAALGVAVLAQPFCAGVLHRPPRPPWTPVH
jgi:hypothetical protein